jgi:hypothetical protein
LSPEWQEDAKYAALADRALYRDAAAVFIQDL